MFYRLSHDFGGREQVWLKLPPVDLEPQTISEALLAAFRTLESTFGPFKTISEPLGDQRNVFWTLDLTRLDSGLTRLDSRLTCLDSGLTRLDSVLNTIEHYCTLLSTIEHY